MSLGLFKKTIYGGGVWGVFVWSGFFGHPWFLLLESQILNNTLAHQAKFLASAREKQYNLSKKLRKNDALKFEFQASVV